MYASASLGTIAYNELFLVYVTLFSASLVAFLLSVRAINPGSVDPRGRNRLPGRALSVFILVSGIVTFVVRTSPIVSARVEGTAPARLDSYTTPVTYALDLALIVPATFAAAVLVRRRDPRGYLVALSLLVLEAMLAPLITAQTVAQVRAGVTFPPAQIAGPIAGFAVIATVALWLLVRILRTAGPAERTDC